MRSLKISQASFEPSVHASETLVLRFVLSDADVDPDQNLQDKFPDVVFGHVQINQEPDLASMFSLNNETALAIFRQKIILFLEKGDLDSERLGGLLTQISALDMDQIRLNMEKEKAEQALHTRRACPTVRRMPG